MAVLRAEPRTWNHQFSGFNPIPATNSASYPSSPHFWGPDLVWLAYFLSLSWSCSTTPLQISCCSSGFSNTELHTISPNNSAFENHTPLQRKNKTNRKKPQKVQLQKVRTEQVTCCVYDLTLTSLPMASYTEWQRKQTPISLPDPRAKSSVELTSCPLSRPPPHPILNCHSSNQLAPSFGPRKCYCWKHFKGKFLNDFTLSQACKAVWREFKSSALFPSKPMNMLGIQLISGIKASF